MRAGKIPRCNGCTRPRPSHVHVPFKPASLESGVHNELEWQGSHAEPANNHPCTYMPGYGCIMMQDAPKPYFMLEKQSAPGKVLACRRSYTNSTLTHTWICALRRAARRWQCSDRNSINTAVTCSQDSWMLRDIASACYIWLRGPAHVCICCEWAP